MGSLPPKQWEKLYTYLPDPGVWQCVLSLYRRVQGAVGGPGRQNQRQQVTHTGEKPWSHTLERNSDRSQTLERNPIIHKYWRETLIIHKHWREALIIYTHWREDLIIHTYWREALIIHTHTRTGEKPWSFTHTHTHTGVKPWLHTNTLYLIIKTQLRVQSVNYSLPWASVVPKPTDILNIIQLGLEVSKLFE